MGYFPSTYQEIEEPMAIEPPGDPSSEAARIEALEREVLELRRALAEARRDDRTPAPNARLPAVIAHAPVVLFAFDAGGTITLQEGQLLEALGLKPGQRVGENVFDTYRNLPDSHPTIARALAGEPCTWEGTVGPSSVPAGPASPAAKSRDLQIRLVPELDREGKVVQVVGLAIDVSEQKRVERQLTASEARLRTITEQLPELVVVLVDRAGLVTWVTSSAERVIGVPRERLVGTEALDFVSGEHRSEVESAVTRLFATPGATYSLETEIIRPDGGRRWLEVSAMNGLEVPHFESVVVVYRDITERRRAQSELAATHEQLRQAQKLEAIGSLAGGIAHDFNNLLTVILSCASLVLSELPRHDPSRADLEEIVGAAERAADLTRQLLSFSRQQVLAPLVVDPREVLIGLERMLARLLGEHIRLTLNLDPTPTRVFVDPTQLEQIIINLTVNSRDAMPEGGLLTIECGPAHLDEDYAAQHLEVRPGRYVMIAVSDTGVGMSPEVMARIFEPFFTTKDVGRGTGLGLATVFGIVRQSGGHIWTYSERGVGTTFRIYLPETNRTTPTLGTSRPGPATLLGTETVLLVEDDSAVRQTMRTILARHGYKVLEAANGGEALLICEQHAGPIDLLVTDVIMPRMSGRQLASRLTTDRPGLKVLFVSGYTELAAQSQSLLSGDVHYLAKPVTPTSMALKVREILDTPT